MLSEKQTVLDQLVVWQYRPSEDVAELASRTEMSDKGRFLYYTAQPSIEESENFNQDCQRQEKGNAILGCYTLGRIYIYNVKDTRLDGVKEVTSAHEMLHVAYDRLSDSERSNINKLLEAEYSKQNSKDLNDRMDYYARTQPGQRSNELHSIIGTEFTNISPELEQYYSKYFKNRSAVTAYFKAYSSKFESLRNESENLLKEINELVDTINKESEAYKNDLNVLNQDILAFNEKASSGKFTSRSEFLAERDVLVSRGDNLKQRREVITDQINEHNAKQAQYNSLVDESNSLNRSLDSTLASPSSGVEGLGS